MKLAKPSTLIFIVLMALCVGYFYKKYRIAPTIDLLKQEVFDENNIKKDLSSYKGKKLIITYYASWCPDCLKEMKALDEVKINEFSDVEVIAITDESQEKLVTFKNKKNYPFTFFRLNQSFDKINIYSIPVTYIVSTNGNLVYEKVGVVDWKNISFREHIKALF